MKQCELCGDMYDSEVWKTTPPCPECFEIKVSYPRLVKWITKVVEFAVARAVYAAGADIYRHAKLNKHERNNHYIGYMS